MEVRHGAWKKVRWEFYENRETNGESNVWSTAGRLKRAMDLVMMLGLKEATDQCSLVWSCVEEDGHVLTRALDLAVEGQRKKGRLKRMWKQQVEEESV